MQAKPIYKRQTHPLLRGWYITIMTARVQLENKGREKSMVVSLKGLCAKMN
jgi:hypothetical protein